MTDSPNTVPVVVVTHHGPGADVARCLAALARSSTPGPIVVVDNGDGAPARSHDPASYGPGDVTVVATANAGYGAAANAGWAAAQRLVEERGGSCSAVALLNDDVEVTDGWLPPLIAALSGDVGAVQPKLLFAERREGRHVVNSRGVQLDRCGAGSDIGFGDLDVDAPEVGADPSTIEIFTGGAVVFSPAFLDATDGFDPRYFLYYEDVDLALRGRELGWTYRCVSSSVVFHRRGSSTASLGEDIVRLQDRNRLWIAFRFGSPRRIVFAVGLSVRQLGRAPRRAHRRALVEGLRATPRLLAARARGSRSSP